MFLIPAFSQRGELGVFGGVAYYIGELNPGVQFDQLEPAYGLVYRYNFNTRLAARLTATQATVKGSDVKNGFMEERGLFFESKVNEAALVLELNFLDYFTGSDRSYVTSYIFGGVGVFGFKPEADGADLQSMGTEGQNEAYDGRGKYKLLSMAIPFGMGVKYSPWKKLCIAAEWGMRKTMTDYLDDVSTTYYFDASSVDPENAKPHQLLSDPSLSHKEGMQRGNPQNNDWYSFAGISITYKFTLRNTTRCRDFPERPDYN
jgi:hypothetical protein